MSETTAEEILKKVNEIRHAQLVQEFAAGWESGAFAHDATRRGDFRALNEIKEKYMSGENKNDPSVPRYK